MKDQLLYNCKDDHLLVRKIIFSCISLCDCEFLEIIANLAFILTTVLYFSFLFSNFQFVKCEKGEVSEGTFYKSVHAK